MRLSLLALLLISPVVLAGADAGKRDIDKVNGSIRTEAGQQYGDLETVNGSVTVERGVVAESASTVNGSIQIREDASVETAETVNGAISLQRNASALRNVETVNGGISLAAGVQVGGSLETVNGSMKLRQATVERGLRTVNGSLDIGDASVVRGGITVEKPSGWINWSKSSKPRVIIGENVVVEGDLVFEHEVELFVHPTAKVGRISGVAPVRLDGGELER